ncbi:MAG: hypothetical protein GDA54_06530 [Alphaproteobacteria bacterium GM7ARS4]|nr:hypothetical protein [Alphaproteobacteria bacterium GM7ARS4]
MHIWFATQHSHEPWLQQTPAGDGAWKDIRYTIKAGGEECIWLSVYDEPSGDIKTCAPWQQRILFVSEPPALKQYPKDYVDQFGIVVSPCPFLYPIKGEWVRTQACLNWHYNAKRSQTESYAGSLVPVSHAWQDMKKEQGPKERLVSTITSRKTMLPIQIQRVRFIEALLRRMGEGSLHVYGRDDNFVETKADAIRRYRYHIVLENNIIPHFWTEKIADCYIGEAYPLYCGCPNLEAYFPKESFIPINVFDIDKACAIVEETCNTNIWEQNHNAIIEAKRLVMEDYNVFAVIARIIKNRPERKEKQSAKSMIYPSTHFRHRQHALKRFIFDWKKEEA